MRFLAVALVATMLVLSGCFGKDDEGDGATPTPDPTPTTPPTGATPTPTATPTSATPTPTAPATPAPREVCTITFDFSSNPNPQTPHAATTCTVPAGYTKLTLSGNFSATAPAGPGLTAQGVSVALQDPTGTAAATCSVAAGPLQATTPCTQESGSAAAGDWKLQPAGVGTIRFVGSVMAS